MAKLFAIAIRSVLVTLLLTGIAYPLAVTGTGQLLFSRAAQGSLVEDNHGHVVGSALIGQPFHGAAYFSPRPSAAGEKGWDASASSGSNLGPLSQKLRDRVKADRDSWQQANPTSDGVVPAELLATSASGLDPHISPEAARFQIARVAQARGIAASRVLSLVDAQIEGRDLGFLGERRVNVLLLNLALDRQFGKTSP